jgi:hypothetical protein
MCSGRVGHIVVDISFKASQEEVFRSVLRWLGWLSFCA